MRPYAKKKPTLLPAVALAALGALIAIPALSQSTLYAAGPVKMTTVTVRTGENLWTIADRFTAHDASTQDTIDRIMEVNHLRDATIVPGERLAVPR